MPTEILPEEQEQEEREDIDHNQREGKRGHQLLGWLHDGNQHVAGSWVFDQ